MILKNIWMWGEGSDEKLREGAKGLSRGTWGPVGGKTFNSICSCSPNLSWELSGHPQPSACLLQPRREKGWVEAGPEADRRMGTVQSHQGSRVFPCPHL